jgi:hypothetical protein
MNALVKLRQLPVSLFVLSGRGFNQRYLPLDLLQFLLRFLGCFHVLTDSGFN